MRDSKIERVMRNSRSGIQARSLALKDNGIDMSPRADENIGRKRATLFDLDDICFSF